MVETSARFEELRIRLSDPVHGLQGVSAVLGTPRWWPTGARVGVVLAHDSGSSLADPLLVHLNKNGLSCRRIVSLEELLPDVLVAAVEGPGQVVCRRCGKSSTIEHHGGQWCTNCGSFASPPDPKQLPSQQPGFRESRRGPIVGLLAREQERSRLPECGWCHQRVVMGDGIYDDGEWMCGGCIARYAHD